MSGESTPGEISPTTAPAGASGATGGHAGSQRAAIEAVLRSRFRYAGKGDATRILFQATLEHLLEKTT